MKSFRELMIERAGGGESAGKLEIAKTPVNTAQSYAAAVLGDMFGELKGFESNYAHAQRQARLGWTKRKDMPVITSRDVHQFQNSLSAGFIDLKRPFAPDTKPSNPFPEGLSGEKAARWLENGLAKHDGNPGDDRVKVDNRRIAVGELKPIQQQIYFDKALTTLIRNGIDGARNFLQNQTIYITSSDNYIIDGHHRYLAAMILDPQMKVQTIAINLPIKVLLPLAVAYGDAIGNKRNQ